MPKLKPLSDPLCQRCGKRTATHRLHVTSTPAKDDLPTAGLTKLAHELLPSLEPAIIN